MQRGDGVRENLKAVVDFTDQSSGAVMPPEFEVLSDSGDNA